MVRRHVQVGIGRRRWSLRKPLEAREAGIHRDPTHAFRPQAWPARHSHFGRERRSYLLPKIRRGDFCGGISLTVRQDGGGQKYHAQRDGGGKPRAHSFHAYSWVIDLRDLVFWGSRKGGQESVIFPPKS